MDFASVRSWVAPSVCIAVNKVSVKHVLYTITAVLEENPKCRWQAAFSVGP